MKRTSTLGSAGAHSEVAKGEKEVTLFYEQGCYYHLFNRGCNKELIFREKSDYDKLMKIIKDSKMNDYLQLCAFALMTNHYHFLVKQTSSKSVSSWIKYIFNIYVKYFNKKYYRKGTLFEGKVKAKKIDKLEYLGLVTNYINSNPQNKLNFKYSTFPFLKQNSIIHLPFYHEFFNSVAEYLEQFDEYKNIHEKNKMIDEYIFE